MALRNELVLESRNLHCARRDRSVVCHLYDYGMGQVAGIYPRQLSIGVALFYEMWAHSL